PPQPSPAAAGEGDASAHRLPPPPLRRRAGERVLLADAIAPPARAGKGEGARGPGWAYAIATLGGVGRLPGAPGTWGSLPVLPAAFLGPWVIFPLGIALAILGYAAIRALLRHGAADDPGWVVVDEAVGMLIALAGLGGDPSLLGVVLAFLLFRAFDIAKPWPISRAERWPGAAGVMLDDVVAGMFACAVLVIARNIAPGVF
ncbi:MAG TPA: phosphatidylglycerophosphatase A, partial [Acetobacteraceae bacterium]|nr:phosphatidylglycerophosphatase A [Acetobacteraceae bacterium]